MARHPRITGFDGLVRPNEHASALGYRMPGEFEPLAAVWLTPPENPETWPGCLDQAQKQFADWMALLSRAVKVCTTTELGIPTNDSWVRDFGPIFVVCDNPTDNQPPLACHDFHFNTWGEKYEVRDLDDRVPQYIAEALNLPIWVHDFVLEGGSIDANGQGTLLTTEQCLLNPNRNPGYTKKQIESILHQTLAATHVIWLPGGIEGDDTDGHIDDVARFVAPDTVVAIAAEPGHPDHAVTAANLRILRSAKDQAGQALNVVELPVPKPIMYDYPDGSSPVPASYANFLIANGHVFVPVFSQPSDDRALSILADVMRDYSVVPVPAEHLVVGLGALHCLSQHQPII